MSNNILSRLATTFALALLACLATPRAEAQTDPGSEARSKTLEVIRTAQDVQVSLGQYSQAVRQGETTDTSALDAATGQAMQLDTQIIRLEGMIDGLPVEQAALTREVVAQAKSRIEKVDDALIFQASPVTQASIEWCDGAINCLFLKSSCSPGCFVQYGGYFEMVPTEGGCFDPCPH